MKVFPPPLFAMISMLASPKLGSNGENGTIWRDGVSSKIPEEPQSLPRDFSRQQVCCMQRQALQLAFRLFRHPWERPDINSLLRESLRNTPGAIHSSDGVE